MTTCGDTSLVESAETAQIGDCTCWRPKTARGALGSWVLPKPGPNCGDVSLLWSTAGRLRASLPLYFEASPAPSWTQRGQPGGGRRSGPGGPGCATAPSRTGTRTPGRRSGLRCTQDDRRRRSSVYICCRRPRAVARACLRRAGPSPPGDLDSTRLDPTRLDPPSPSPSTRPRLALAFVHAARPAARVQHANAGGRARGLSIQISDQGGNDPPDGRARRDWLARRWVRYSPPAQIQLSRNKLSRPCPPLPSQLSREPPSKNRCSASRASPALPPPGPEPSGEASALGAPRPIWVPVVSRPLPKRLQTLCCCLLP